MNATTDRRAWKLPFIATDRCTSIIPLSLIRALPSAYFCASGDQLATSKLTAFGLARR